MLAEQFATAARTATLAQLDNLAKQAWSAWGEGYLTDSTAEAVTEAIEARRATIRQRAYQNGSSAPRMPSKRPSSPDRRKSITRRRKQAASGVVPARLACHFTQGQIAALTVIAGEVKKHGNCSIPIDQIAALAGVCRTIVQTALREAERLRLVTVQERRRAGRPSLTNVIRIVDQQWRMWLRLGGKGGRMQKSKHHENTDSSLEGVQPRQPLAFTVCSGIITDRR
jgi:hypothetical protein